LISKQIPIRCTILNYGGKNEENICSIGSAFFAGLSREVYAQGTNSNWQPPPFPPWFRSLEKYEQDALVEIGVSSWIANIAVHPGLVRIETRRIIDQHGVAWAYNEDDQNVFSIIMRVNGQFRQIMISRYWLDNLR
jgi:hypothetical protein